jgi:hypothetical protein
MQPAPDPLEADWIVTCHTAGCDVVDVPVAIVADDWPAPTVVCGRCGNPITDIRKVMRI